MTESHSFRPAPLRPPVSLEVRKDGADLGDSWSVAWSEIDALRYSEMTVRETTLISLEIDAGAVTHALSTNSAEARATGERRDFEIALAAFLSSASTARPELTVAFGRAGKTGIWFFVMGLICLLGAVALVSGFVISGLSTDRLIAAALPTLLLALLGAALTWGNRPGQKLPELPVATFLTLLDPSPVETPPEA